MSKLNIKNNDNSLTPMMQQYLGIKKDYQDCLVFYRMGDFFELFMDDAVKAADILNITLTKRGNKNGDDIPMCGVPVHSHVAYLEKLIKSGNKVAICEQVETPDEAKKRGGYKAVVKREVVRIVTQGTLIEDNLLNTSENNYLSCITKIGSDIGLSWLDLSTGEFLLQPSNTGSLSSNLERLSSKEILISETLCQDPEFYDLFADYKDKLTIQPDSRFDSENARLRLEKHFGVGTIDAFGGFSRAEIAAAGALLDYIELTQKGSIPRLSKPHQLPIHEILEIDAATIKNLELIRTLNGDRKGSLLNTIDKTVTGYGSRLLAKRLLMPLTDVNKINYRFDMVQFFIDNNEVKEQSIQFLKQCPDVERALTRLSMNKGGPKDLASIRDNLSKTVQLFKLLNDQKNKPIGITDCLDNLKIWGNAHPLIDLLKKALEEEPTTFARDGGFIKNSYSPALDKLRSLRNHSQKLIAELQMKYIGISKVSGLKIKHNNVIGYFVEVTPLHADKLMVKDSKSDDLNIFIHRQTLGSAVRFSTIELTDLEHQIVESADKALALEQELFKLLVTEVMAQSDAIIKTALSLAELDIATSFAELSNSRNYNRPVIDNSLEFEIKDGRHPVVEHIMQTNNASEDFIPNNCNLSTKSKLWLLTGPNMAGKSTFLRQNALITIMAQIGCYIPAKSAHIGMVDRVFSRVGASDDLARGRSTFMVEMVETASILNQSGERALVILDEIGRGTATFDGLSIAWACIEHLHEKNKCRTLFATHYHELTVLSNKLANLSCHTMQVKEWKDDIIFMHQVIDGSADRSYGIHVAKLAGLPSPVIKRATSILKTLEASEQSGELSKLSESLPLFSNIEEEYIEPQISELDEAINNINPDELTPKQALEALYKIKELKNKT